MQHAQGVSTPQRATHALSSSGTLKPRFKYTLFVNQERFGSYLTLAGLLCDVQIVSDHSKIKIQRTNTITNHHSFTTYTKRGASHA